MKPRGASTAFIVLYLGVLAVMLAVLFYTNGRQMEAFEVACGGSCQTTADCAPGMTCKNNQCCTGA